MLIYKVVAVSLLAALTGGVERVSQDRNSGTPMVLVADEPRQGMQSLGCDSVCSFHQVGRLLP